MGFGISLFSIWKAFSISVPTIADGLTGRGSVERCDARLEDWSHAIVRRCRIDLAVDGLERVPPDRAYVLMSNHQSHLDIPILYVAWKHTLRMVAKAELFKVPVFGKALRGAGFVEVDRSGDKGKAIAAMREAGDAVEKGISIWIAPEGTRSEDGSWASSRRAAS
jgi:1-acyl-sn-glycerol-3-phosphate acyltransferase